MNLSKSKKLFLTPFPSPCHALRPDGLLEERPAGADLQVECSRIDNNTKILTDIKNTDNIADLQTRAAGRDVARAKPCRPPLAD